MGFPNKSNVLSQASPVQLRFQVEARTFGDVFRGGTFRQDLNANNNISVHNNDMRIVFPSFPAVDFRAFSISGTIEFITSGLPLDWYNRVVRKLQFPNNFLLKTHFCKALARTSLMFYPKIPRCS